MNVTQGAPNGVPQPTEIKIRTESRILDVRFDDGSHYQLPFEYLRVFSPSAEVRGHGAGEGTLQLGKQNVGIAGIEPVGNYAIRLVFDDGHNTGCTLGPCCTNWAAISAPTGLDISSAAPPRRPVSAAGSTTARSCECGRVPPARHATMQFTQKELHERLEGNGGFRL